MASLCCSTTTIFSGRFSPRTRTHTQFPKLNRLKTQKQSIKERRSLIVGSIIEDREAIDVKKSDETFDPHDEPKGEEEEDRDTDRVMSRGINAAIVLAAGTVAVTKLLSIDHDYWHGLYRLKHNSQSPENKYRSLIIMEDKIWKTQTDAMLMEPGENKIFLQVNGGFIPQGHAII